MGYGAREELTDAWNMLELQQLPNGRYKVAWTNTYPNDPRNRLPSLGKRNGESRWVTFYALLARKLSTLEARYVVLAPHLH